MQRQESLAMTTASSSTSASGSATPPHPSASTGALPPPPPPPLPPVSSAMRSFAVIICNECLYLEFPGCDVHGVLYTERVLALENEDDQDSAAVAAGDAASARRTRSKCHAKCPSCAAATHNVRPFRDGCRRCKAPTTVSMWCATHQEIAQAHDAFPVHTEECEHTVLICEGCQSVIFPRAREVLTRRTAEEPITTTNGKVLKVTNFQLSMPHVDGCSRKGMPLQTIPIQLPKSELKFVLDRIEQCPRVARIPGGPQYTKRNVELVTQQNHLHQIYLRLLSTVVNSFDPEALRSAEPLKQILQLLSHIEPLALFSDWSPPRQLSKAQVDPVRIVSSSDFDSLHCAQRILETSPSFWRSAAVSDSKSASEEWLMLHFNADVVLSSMTLRWHADHCPSQYSVAVSSDGNAFETVAIIIDSAPEKHVVFDKGGVVSCIKISLFSTKASNLTYGLESISCHESAINSLYTPPNSILQTLQSWLLTASMSNLTEIRDVALEALQRLTLASGSLCGLMQLATGLLMSVSTLKKGAKQFDEQDWNRLDYLSDAAQRNAQAFLTQLSHQIRLIMVDNDAQQAGENALLDKRIIHQMSLLLHDEVTQKTIDKLQKTLPMPAGTCSEMSVSKAIDSAELLQPESLVSDIFLKNEGCLYPLITLAVSRPAFLHSIKRRSQLGMVLLYLLSELSAWHLKRMQKADEYTGKQEEENTRMEEPFAIELCPQFFDLSHRLLSQVLAPWLTLKARYGGEFDEDEEEKMDELQQQLQQKQPEAGNVDMYSMLKTSFSELEAAVLRNDGPESIESQSQSSPTTEYFSPDDMCVAILQIVTSNIRRLVLSRVDPEEIGIEPACVRNDQDLLSAPPALQPLVTSLEQLISLGAKRSDKFFPISLKAAAAVEVGMEAFYPSAHQRTKLLTSRMGKGSTLEIQVRWPVQERDQEDPRYERLILMLQLECIKMGITHVIRGSWHLFMHLIVQVPPTMPTEDVFTKHFAKCIQNAGFSSWQVVAGAQEISINLQRHLHWNRVEKMAHDSGVGWIRVYPRDVACFDDVLADVEEFILQHDKLDSNGLP